MSLDAELLRFPFTRLKWLSPEKQLHTIILPLPNFTLGTTQSDKYHCPGNRQIHPLDCQVEKRDL